MLGAKIQQLVRGRTGNGNDKNDEENDEDDDDDNDDDDDDDDDQEERNLIYSSMTKSKKEPYVDPNEVNRLLVKELNQLSLDNREKVMEEIHGVMDDRNNVNASNNNNNNNNGNGNNNNNSKMKIEEGENALLQQMEYEIGKILTANFATADAAFAIPESSSSIAAAAAAAAAAATSNNHHHHHPPSHHPQQQQQAGGSTSASTRAHTVSSCIIGTAYRKAKLYQSKLIYDRNFRYAFLSKEEMDPKKAALRLLRYLDYIVEVYHTDRVLFRPIMLQDLSENAKQLMYKEGPLQILPIRDPSGRRILVHLRDLGPYYDENTKRQVGAYMAQCLSEDREGVIMVYFIHHTNHKIPDLTELRMVNRLFKTIPAKFSAIHLCCPNIPLYDIVKASVILHIGKELRLRLRLHVGSYTECKYSLKSFGIAVDRLPLNLELWKWSHNVDMKYYRKWLKMRQAKENAIIIQAATALNNNSNNNTGGDGGIMSAVHRIRSIFIETPHQEDCLFGKGSSAMSHPGNVAMRRLLEERYERYEELTAASSTRTAVTVSTKDNNNTTTNNINHKEQLAAEIISEIKRGMGKFLKEDDEYHGLFIEVDDTVARKKIGIAFRDLKKRKLRKQQKQQQQQQQTLPLTLALTSSSSSSNINSRNDEDDDKNNNNNEKRQGEKRAATSTVNPLASSNAHSDSCAHSAATDASIFDVSPVKLHQRRKLCHQCFGGDGTPATA